MTIVVDSGVWIGPLKDRDTRQTRYLRRRIESRSGIIVGDLMMAEVLQGTREDRNFTQTLGLLNLFDTITIASPSIAIQAAYNYRLLRALGITIRKPIDTLIATRCIVDGLSFLYADRDFDPFVTHLGLRSAMAIFPE